MQMGWRVRGCVCESGFWSNFWALFLFVGDPQRTETLVRFSDVPLRLGRALGGLQAGVADGDVVGEPGVELGLVPLSDGPTDLDQRILTLLLTGVTDSTAAVQLGAFLRAEGTPTANLIHETIMARSARGC